MADKIVSGQTEIFSIFKKQSYDDLKKALESWLNPDQDLTEAQTDVPWESKEKTVTAASNSEPSKAPAKASKTDDISAAFI